MTNETVAHDRAGPFAPGHIAALLGTAVTFLDAEFAALPDAIFAWHPVPGEWCALEVVGHFIETEERGFGGRIRTILAEERPRFHTWDPDAVARARRDCERDPAAVLAEFVRRRTTSVALVKTLTPDDLDRGGDHPEVGFLTVRDLLHEWVHHDANHLRQLLANVQAYSWPGLGNAQRFSMPEGEVDSGEGLPSRGI